MTIGVTATGSIFAAGTGATFTASAGLVSGSITLVSGTATGCTLSVGSAAGGTAPYTYQWYQSTSSGFTPGAGNIVSGATNQTNQAFTGLTTNTTYYFVCVVTDSASATANSAQYSYTPTGTATALTLAATTTTGTLGTAITGFSITPNGSYSGTATISFGSTDPYGFLSTGIFTFTWSASSSPQTFSYTPLSSGSIAMTMTNNSSLTNAGSPQTITVSAGPVFVPCTDSNVHLRGFVPWQTSQAACNVNGPYIDLGFTGTSLKMIAWGGGYTGSARITSFVDSTVPYDNSSFTSATAPTQYTIATGLAAGSHTAHLFVNDIQWTQDAYLNNPPTCSVIILGFLIDNGATSTSVNQQSDFAYIFGDSICMGYGINRTFYTSTVGDFGAGVAWQLCKNACGFETHLKGFASAGITVGGSGNTAAFSSSWSKQWSGYSLLNVSGQFSLPFTWIICPTSFNDRGTSSGTLQTAATAMYSALRTAGPNATILLGPDPEGSVVSTLLAAFSGSFGTAAQVATGGGLNGWTLYQGGTDKNAFFFNPGTAIATGLPGNFANSSGGGDGVHPDFVTSAQLAALYSQIVQEVRVIKNGGSGGGGTYYGTGVTQIGF